MRKKIHPITENHWDFETISSSLSISFRYFEIGHFGKFFVAIFCSAPISSFPFNLDRCTHFSFLNFKFYLIFTARFFVWLISVSSRKVNRHRQSPISIMFLGFISTFINFREGKLKRNSNCEDVVLDMVPCVLIKIMTWNSFQ